MVTDEDREEYCRMVDKERLIECYNAEWNEFPNNDPDVFYDVLTLAVARDRVSGIPEKEFSLDTWRLMVHYLAIQQGAEGDKFAWTKAKKLIRIWVPEIKERVELQCDHCRRYTAERAFSARYFEEEGWRYVCPRCKRVYTERGSMRCISEE